MIRAVKPGQIANSCYRLIGSIEQVRRVADPEIQQILIGANLGDLLKNPVKMEGAHTCHGGQVPDGEVVRKMLLHKCFRFFNQW